MPGSSSKGNKQPNNLFQHRHPIFDTAVKDIDDGALRSYVDLLNTQMINLDVRMSLTAVSAGEEAWFDKIQKRYNELAKELASRAFEKEVMDVNK